MSAVIQATCPGCKQVLRLPADWVQQAIRCKHCGAVLQAKPRPTPTATPKLPAQPTRPSSSSAKPPPAAPKPVFAAKAEPILEVLPADSAPVSIKPAAADQCAITVLAEAAAAPRGRMQSRRRGMGPWLLVGLFGFVVVSAGALIAGILASRSGWLTSYGPLPTQLEPSSPTGKETPVSPSGVIAFPRRALVISVNNYLYANPVHYGIPGHGVHTFVDKLANGLRIPKEQVAELSDAAPAGSAKPPTKTLIEKTIGEYLASARPQDRILLVFIGHAVEIGDEVFLAPVEAELTNKETLVPLTWVYEQLSNCPARQKVLVLDVARFNPGRGQERPGGGPLTAKVDAAFKMPPDGVQVWSACVADQSSYEFDTTITNNGIFIEALLDVFNKGLRGVIQKPGEPFPLGELETAVNRYLKAELAPLQKAQTSRVSGKEPAEGAAYDAQEKLPPKFVIPTLTLPDGAAAEPRLVRAILKEIDVPAVKATREDMRLKPESLPPFPAKVMDAYKADDKKSPLRDAVAAAQTALQKQGGMERLQEYYNAPGENKTAFNTELEKKGKQLGKAIFDVGEALEAMTKVEEERDKETPRWQADYDYLLARLKAQLAYLNEYSALLGQMRKDQQPPLEPKVHSGWRVASQTTVSDATAKKYATESRKTLEKLMKEHPDTPWAILAKRDHLTSLGLEWQPTK
jgi:hypothetical protein